METLNLKDLVLDRVQKKLRKTISVKDEIETKFGEWFLALVQGAQSMAAPPMEEPPPA